MALSYLLSSPLVPPSHITIYMSYPEYMLTEWVTSYTSRGVNVKCVEDAMSSGERDAAMTRESGYDILRYRSETECKELYGGLWRPRVSNTEMNERRRKGIASRVYNLEGSMSDLGVANAGDSVAARNGDAKNED